MTETKNPTKGSNWSYAPSPESSDHFKLKDQYGLFIGGKFVPAASGKRFATINPTTEKVLAHVADAGEKDVDKAVRAARTAYEKIWRKMSGRERGKYLYRIARIIQERSRE